MRKSRMDAGRKGVLRRTAREPRKAEESRVAGKVGVVGGEERDVGEVILNRGNTLSAEPDWIDELNHIGLEGDYQTHRVSRYADRR